MREQFEPVALVPDTLKGWKYTGNGVPDTITLALAKAGYLWSEDMHEYNNHNVLTLTPRHGTRIEVLPQQFILMTDTGGLIYLGTRASFVYQQWKEGSDNE